MTKLLDWRRTEDPRDVIHMAVQALAEGHLVAFPNDGHYTIAASGLRSQSVARLAKIACGQTSQDSIPHLSLMVRSVDELLDYSPSASRVAMRIGLRCWPGPVELLLEDQHHASLVQALPVETRDEVLKTGDSFSVACPRHEAFLQVSRLTAGPLVLSQALNRLITPACDFPLALEASQVSPEVALVIDSGRIEKPGCSTVVKVSGSTCQIVREGIMHAEHLAAATMYTILIVCTGNTCRSPMAEALLKAKLEKAFQNKLSVVASSKTESEPIQAADSHLGFLFRVLSAGVAAQGGGSASEGAIRAMEDRGLNLREHQSRSISQGLLERSDLILTMTTNHRQAILSRWPNLAPKVFGVAPSGKDISDPYGGTLEAYRSCADCIDEYLEAWVEQLDVSLFPIWIPSV